MRKTRGAILQEIWGVIQFLQRTAAEVQDTYTSSSLYPFNTFLDDARDVKNTVALLSYLRTKHVPRNSLPRGVKSTLMASLFSFGNSKKAPSSKAFATQAQYRLGGLVDMVYWMHWYNRRSHGLEQKIRNMLRRHNAGSAMAEHPQKEEKLLDMRI